MYDNLIEALCDGDLPDRDFLRDVILVSAVQKLYDKKEKDAAATASFSTVKQG